MGLSQVCHFDPHFTSMTWHFNANACTWLTIFATVSAVTGTPQARLTSWAAVRQVLTESRSCQWGRDRHRLRALVCSSLTLVQLYTAWQQEIWHVLRIVVMLQQSWGHVRFPPDNMLKVLRCQKAVGTHRLWSPSDTSSHSHRTGSSCIVPLQRTHAMCCIGTMLNEAMPSLLETAQLRQVLSNSS